MSDIEDILTTESPVRRGWLTEDLAQDEILAFEARFGPAHTRLACHAAFPLFLTPKLVNLIRINFLEDQVPWIAEVDLLLSSLCRQLDEDLFVVDPGIREVLLADLLNWYGPDEGINRLNGLANFLLAYLERYTTPSSRSDVLRAHRWIIWSLLNPARVVEDMTALLRARPTAGAGPAAPPIADQILITTMIEVVQDPLKARLPLESYRDLIETAQMPAQYWYRGPAVLDELRFVSEAGEVAFSPRINPLLAEVIHTIRPVDRTRLAEPPPEPEHSPAPVLWPDSPPTIPADARDLELLQQSLTAGHPILVVGNQRVRIYDVGFSAGYFHAYDHFQTNGAAYPEREIQVFLPRNYESERNRYPVVYMHDGTTAFFKGGLANQTWDVANTLGNFYREHAAPKFIVVAIYPVDRNREYTHAAWSGSAWGGLSSYCSCIADWIKPFIDEHYRTLPERENTMILGSSHGGLAAFYIANQRPDKFGFCSALSPSFWVGVDHGEGFPVVMPDHNASLKRSQLIAMCHETLADVKRRPIIYLDWGLVRTGGPHNEFIEERATARAREMVQILQTDYGYRIGQDLLVYEDPQGEHNEESWGKHVPRILQYFIRQRRCAEPKGPDDHEPKIPPKPRCFGREQEVEALVRTILLEPQPRPAIVLGAPGIGKSTVCMVALHNEGVKTRYEGRRFFVQCEGLRSLGALISAIAKALNISVAPDLETEEYIGAIERSVFAKLRQSPAVLVLDNAGTSYDADEVHVQKCFANLSQIPGLALIVSMRGRIPPSGTVWGQIVHLEPLELEHAQEAFLAVAGERFRKDAYLETVLSAMGRVPLYLELFAHQAQAYNSLQHVFDLWKREKIQLPDLDGFDLRLMSSLNDVRGIPTKGKDLIIVAEVNNVLHFRIFDGDGKVVVDTDEQRLTEQARQIKDLRKQLESLWPPHKLTGSDKGRVVTAVTSIVGHTHLDAFVGHTHLDALIEVSITSPRITDYARRLLYLLAVLPDGIAHSGLEVLLPDCGIQAERTLLEVGLAYGDRNRVRMHEPVRHIVAGRHRPQADDLDRAIKYFVTLAAEFESKYSSAGGKEAVERITAESSNLEEMLLLGLQQPDPMPAVDAAQSVAGVTLFSGGGTSRVLEEAYEVAKRLGHELSRADCSRRLGDIAKRRGDYTTAQKRFEEALELYTRLQQKKRMTWCIQSLGEVYLLRSDHEHARDLFLETRKIYKELGDLRGEAATIKDLGDTARERGEYDLARNYYEEALSLYTQEEYVLGRANCIQGLADIELRMGNQGNARARYADAERLYEEIADLLGQANCLKGQGDAARDSKALDAAERLKDLDAAKRFYDKAESYYQRLQSPICLANLYEARGELAAAHGTLDAREMYNEAVRQYRRAGHPRGEAFCIKSLAQYCLKIGDLPEAEMQFIRACDLFQKLEIPDQQGACIKQLGDVALRRGDKATAKQKYLEALPKFKQTTPPDKFGLAYCFSSLGDLERESEPPQYAVARDYYREASRLFRETHRLNDEARTLCHLGEIELEQGEVALAKEHLGAALSLYQNMKDQEGIDRVQSFLAIKVFLCYSSKDDRLRRDLETFLASLKREKKITIWYDRIIPPGKEWEGEIDGHLESARIILLLVSPHFLESDYIYDREMKRALERHNAGEACVIPIILRPCDWEGAPFGKLQALPRDGRPIVNWPRRDEAFRDVATGIRNVVEELAQNP